MIKPLGFADDVRLGEEIPLARVRVTDQGEFDELDLTVRRVARGLVRPHILGGQVRQGSLAIQGSPWHWTAWIDTSSGGFLTDTPFYFVNLVEHPWLSPNSGFAMTIALTPDFQQHLLGPFISVQSPSRTSFTLDVRMAAVDGSAYESMPAQAQGLIGLKLPVAVNWVGIELISDRQPPFESSQI